ncbi:MAG: ribonuclease domain-containing protein [Eubacteriales bacterium]|nr:ribonuclease domain-containing protein [Eubacteriales bacterium]
MRIVKRGFLLSLALCLALSLIGCSSQTLNQAAQLLLEEYASQQPQGAVPSPALDLWTSPPDAVNTPKAAKTPQAKPSPSPHNAQDNGEVTYGKAYTTPEDVARYLHEYGELPSNFITKSKAKALGWDAAKGNLQKVAPGMSIGGDYFSNYEGTLPTAKGRKWYECDVNYAGGYRGAERILYASDGLIFYTDDHYNTFKQLY